MLQGIRTGKIPFELWSGGQIFWQHLQANPRHEATFDAAMHEVNQFGGTAVAVNYPWSKFDCVVDVAGGVGGFLADILGRHPQLRGVLFDQPAQIQRAQAVGENTCLLRLALSQPMLMCVGCCSGQKICCHIGSAV
jgi:hypothetical protein